MIAYAARRLLQLPIVLFVIVTAAFFIMRAIPGGPFSNEKAVEPEIRRLIEAKYHLDWPVPKQFAQYVGPFNLDDRAHSLYGGDHSEPWGGLLTGDLGLSFRYRNQTVTDIIGRSFPVSAVLGSLAMLLAISIGMPAGVIAAHRRGHWEDWGAMAVAMVGICIPNFVLGPLLVIVFVFKMELLPVAGWGSVQHMVLPAIVLGLPYAAYISRLSKGAMLEAIEQDFVRTARAKGLSERVVILKHALRNAFLPVLSFLGPATAGILSGSVVVERIFNVPGMGTWFVQGALNRDYLLVIGAVLVYAVLLTVLNLLVDLLYAVVDPRIKLS